MKLTYEDFLSNIGIEDLEVFLQILMKLIKMSKMSTNTVYSVWRPHYFIIVSDTYL